MVRLTAINGSAVMETADGPNVSRVVLRGTDPTIFTANGQVCKLLLLRFNRLPRSIRADERNPMTVTGYVQSQQLPRPDSAKAIAVKIQEITGHPSVRVEILTDAWFIQSTFFPLWYPFMQDREPLSFSEYASRGEVFCSGNERGIRCSRMQILGP